MPDAEQGVEAVMVEKAGRKPRLSWLAGGGAVLSVLACYGTIALIAVLSLLGVTIAVNVHVWAAAIVGFAVIAFSGVVLRARSHGRTGSVITAALGVVLIIISTYASDWLDDEVGINARIVEALGFAALVTGAGWDWLASRFSRNG